MTKLKPDIMESEEARIVTAMSRRQLAVLYAGLAIFGLVLLILFAACAYLFIIAPVAWAIQGGVIGRWVVLAVCYALVAVVGFIFWSDEYHL